jgi:hypothetical protein
MKIISDNRPFHMNRVLAILLLAVLAGGAGFAVHAASIIGFKIESPKNSDQNYMFAGDYAGAPGVRTNNWNNLHSLVDANTTAQIIMPDGSVSNSAGSIVSGMAVVFQPNLAGGGIFNRTAGGTNDGKMFADVADTFNCSGFSQYGYIDITNIPYASYQIYCYFRPDNGNGSANTRGGFWCITNTPTGTNRLYIQNQSNDVAQTQEPVPSNTGDNYVQSTTTAIASGANAWSAIQGGNYAVFSGLTNSYTRVWFGGLGNGTGGKDDLGNSVTGGSVAVRFKVCAFQIVQVPTGVATALYLAASNQVLHAGNPTGTQLTVLADLDTGATGVDETSGSTFTSDNTNVLTVSASGLMTPGTNGTANVIVNFQTKFYTNPVTVIGPTSLAISVAKTNLLAGNGQGDTTTATLLATYSDAANVTVNAYKFVSFGGSGGITVTSNGTLTAVSAGAFSVTGSYDGLSVTTNNVGVVTSYTSPGSVQTFSVNLTDAADPMSFHDLSGAPGARVAYWNNLVMSFGAVTNQITNPVDYQGNALSGTIVQVLPNNPFSQTLLTAGTRTTNESIMFNTFFDQGANNGTSPQSFIVVSNVPYASYDAYFYFYNDNSSNGTNRPGQVTINGVTQYRINSTSYPNTPDNSGSGYVQAVQPGTTPTSIATVPYGNYIKFASLTDSTLNVTWGAVGQDVFLDASGVTRVRLAGFQLVKSLGGLTATNIYLQSAVPAQLPGNPASYALTVLADFSDGTTGGNITALSGMGYSSSNTNVFNVDTSGVITPGLTPGVATLTVTYQTKALNASVTNLAPTSVAVVAKPGTVYLDGSLGITTAQASLYATFPGLGSVNVSSFNSVAYVDQGSSVATMDSAGAITALTQGQANLGASYLGTTNVTANAFTVSSVANAAVLKHLYNFTNTTQVIDSIGGANGTVYPPTGANQPITLDGARAIFPGDGTYANAPYIALPAGLISAMGDVTIEMWCGRSQLNTWARYFSFGSTTKGTDPHNTGSMTSGIQMMDSYGGTGLPDFSGPGWTDFKNTYGFTNGAEYHIVAIIAPNAGMAYFYLNGVLVTNAAPTAAPLSTTVNDTVDWLGVSFYADSPLAGWINQLAIYEGVLSPSQITANYTAGVGVYLPPVTVSTVPTNIVTSVSGGSLTLSWPADHLGWSLQVQTNALNSGLGANWVTVPGSSSTTNAVIPIDSANGSVFYRLFYQP